MRSIAETTAAASTGGHVVFNYEGGSRFVVAIIPEMHNLPQCQQDVFATLQSLRPLTSFVAVEGVVGELEHEVLRDEENGRARSEEVRALARYEAQQRRELVDYWRANGHFPRTALAGQPVHAAVLYEALVQDEIRSQGMEHLQLYRRANRLAYRHERTRLPVPWTTVIYARNRVFADKLEHYGNYLSAPGRDVVPFPVGAAHANDLTRRLRRAGISYAIVLHDSCIPARR